MSYNSDDKIEIFDDVNYKVVKELGKGAWANVYQLTATEFKGVQDILIPPPEMKNVACKIVLKSKLTKKSSQDSMKKEISIQKMLKHPNIISLIQSKETEDTVYLLMELCTISLQDILNEKQILSEQETLHYVRQLIQALYYLHNTMGVIHRDIKPANLLICDDKLKLADFGLATYSGEPFSNMCGTPNYVSPEMIIKKPWNSSSDMWAVGVMTFIMLFGYSPFLNDAKTFQDLFNNIIDIRYTFKNLTNIGNDEYIYEYKSKEGVIYKSEMSILPIKLIIAILQKDPEDRPTALELLEL